MEQQDPAVEALMAELRSVVDGSELSTASDALDETTNVFTTLCREFDKVIPESVTGTLAVITTLDEEGTAQAIADMLSGKAEYLKDADTTDDDIRSGRGKPAKVELIAPSVVGTEMLTMLSDTEASILLNAWKNPVSLISRVRLDNELLQVMVTASTMVFIKTLPSGDTITKRWSSDVSTPTREEVDSDYEFDLIRLTYSYLAEPHIIKQKSQEAFDLLVASIGHKMERQMREAGIDLDESDEG
jgi:hypothetical protein